jgi:hypothetical protein
MGIKEWFDFFIHRWTITRVVRWAFLLGLAVVSGIYLFYDALSQYLKYKILIIAYYFAGVSLAYIMGWTLGTDSRDKDEK